MHRYGPLTRAAATEHAGLARSAAGQAVVQLETAGLIRSGEQRAIGAGRPSVVLAADPEGPLVVAVKAEPTALHAAAYGIGLRRDREVVRRIDLWGISPDRLVSAVLEVAGEVLQGQWQRCAGLGLAFPGMVDEAAGIAQISLVIDWREPAPMADLLRAVLPQGGPLTDELTVALVRDSTAVGIGEYGAASAGVLLAVAGERHGMGSALVGGADRARTLEIGHLCADPSGPRCTCGARGCLGLYIGGPELCAALGIAPPSTDSDAEVEEAVREALADPANAAAVQDLAGHLSRALTSVVNTVGPDEVVFTGLLGLLAAAAPEQIATGLRESVVARVRGTRYRLGRTPRAALAGTAELAFAGLLADPSKWRAASTAR
ncbi:ROK family protein [Streptomyces kasugaensis]|uniref:ROK family protein n=1 Tax=Streptomyces kasugaensis TaxID=1946 RepID=UPI0013EF87FE|nr:ROK family protein [Streptomyces kasugaensis]